MAAYNADGTIKRPKPNEDPTLPPGYGGVYAPSTVKNPVIAQPNTDFAKTAKEQYASGNVGGAYDTIFKNRADKIAYTGNDYGVTNDELWASLVKDHNNSDNKYAQIQYLLRDMGNTSYDKSKNDIAFENLVKDYNNYGFDTFLKSDEYKQLYNMYDGNAKNAMKDTLGEVAARTGGYASSYAATAGQQQYNQQMQALAALAQDVYRKEKSSMLDNVSLAKSLADRDYSRWQESRDYDNGLKQNELSILMNLYNNDLSSEQAKAAAEQSAYAEQVKKAREGIENSVKNGGMSINELIEDYPEWVALSGYNAYELQGLANEHEQNLKQREFENSIKKQNADTNSYKAKNGSSGGSSGSKGGSKSGVAPSNVDWSYVMNLQENNGPETAENYIKGHYRELGFTNVSEAIATWKVYCDLTLNEDNNKKTTSKPGTIYIKKLPERK